tara:strand:+ start:553 stop:678 length:126 start_codon:yes stop_codon:yes gene_type:complete
MKIRINEKRKKILLIIIIIIAIEFSGYGFFASLFRLIASVN